VYLINCHSSHHALLVPSSRTYTAPRTDMYLLLTILRSRPYHAYGGSLFHTTIWYLYIPTYIWVGWVTSVRHLIFLPVERVLIPTHVDIGTALHASQDTPQSLQQRSTFTNNKFSLERSHCNCPHCTKSPLLPTPVRSPVFVSNCQLGSVRISSKGSPSVSYWCTIVFLFLILDTFSVERGNHVFFSFMVAVVSSNILSYCLLLRHVAFHIELSFHVPF
jgi:hypothetical protein